MGSWRVGYSKSYRLLYPIYTNGFMKNIAMCYLWYYASLLCLRAQILVFVVNHQKLEKWTLKYWWISPGAIKNVFTKHWMSAIYILADVQHSPPEGLATMVSKRTIGANAISPILNLNFLQIFIDICSESIETHSVRYSKYCQTWWTKWQFSRLTQSIVIWIQNSWDGD